MHIKISSMTKMKPLSEFKGVISLCDILYKQNGAPISEVHIISNIKHYIQTKSEAPMEFKLC